MGSARFGGEVGATKARRGRLGCDLAREEARWAGRPWFNRGRVNASGDERASELLCSSGSRAAAASWLGGSAAAGSGQEGPWLEEEVDPAGSEAGKGADGVGEEHGDGA